MKSRVPAPARQAAAVQRRAQAGPGARAGSRAPSLHVVGGGLDGAVLLRLQATAGNQAVGQFLAGGTSQAAGSRLSVQTQAAACPPAPVETPQLSPKDDPRFAAVGSRIGQEATRQKSHPPPAAKVAEAQGAAAGPTNEVRSKAAADQVDEISRKKPKGFDKAGFVKAFNEAVEKATPKNMEQVDDFSKSGKAAQIKDQVVGSVAAGKDNAAKDVKEANSAPPDTSKEKPKPVKPLKPEQPGPAPADPKAGGAMPPPRPADQVSLAHAPCETEGQMAEGGVTEQQVKDSNEPQFQDAMSAKKEADAHAATAPQQFRQQEQQALGEAQGGAAAAAAGGLSAMHQQKAGALGHVASHKDQAKAKDEAERARVATDIEAIYTDTKKDVDEILKGLDKKVGDAFDSGEKAAREAFESYYKKKKDDFFDDRYSGLGGGLRWLKDKLISPPDEVNGFIVESKQLYTTRMGQVVDGVADLVEAELNRATKRVQDGRKQIQDYVAKQPKELRKVAQEAAAKFESSFEELDQAVDSKSGELVDDLAQRYVEAAKVVDERCNEMREENKSLLQKAKDKIAGMIEAIGKIKDMLAQMAARAANVAGRIIKHPIDFLGKLVDALKMGFNQFVGNIGKHLMDGLLGWLFGELADTGITMPESLDLKGILHLVLQVLGLTWENIRKRAAAMLGEEVVGMIEQGAGMFQKVANIFNTIKTEGLAGLWHLIQDKIGDLKSQVLDQIMNFVRDKIITAGVTWILSLLNPASAFIKACKMIYDIVMFFVERGQQIMALVNTILDNLEAILDGNLSAAANLVESVMAKGLTVAISFLASLLGVGGITDKIKEVINVVRSPVFKAVDWVLKTIVKPVAKLAAKAVGWVKGKAGKAKEWGKKKLDAAKAKVKEKFKKTFGKKDERTMAQKESDLRGGITAAEALLDKPEASHDSIRAALRPIQQQYRMTSLRLVVDQKGKENETVHIEGAVNPSARSKKALISLLPKKLLEKLKSMGLNQTAIASIVAKSPNSNQVSGELFEQLGYLAGQKMAKEQRVQFFAGGRISSVQGKQYTDGILGIRKGAYLFVHTILEAKAGPIAAPKLATDEQLKPTNKDQAERISVAVDDFKEDNPRWRPLTAADLYRRFPRQIDQRADVLPRTEPGQARRDIERGAAEEGRKSSTWLLDGEPVRLVVSPTMTRIHALLPADVSGAGDATAIKADGINYAVTNLSVTTTELMSLTQKIVAAAK